ncbi:MAG: DUF5069 domain-containing protein [Nitrospirae bacterium]|nr:DUF5069 domain-containing protein [Nitrospirota bacterium]MBI3594168.1 DUF5069 domain-containing protein [Nitrospirota bacterium]
MSLNVKNLDLSKTFPASPREVFGGYVHLARMRDKARAKAAGTLGEYHYPCPLDKALLEFLNLTPEAFIAEAQKETNEELLRWVKEKAARKSPDELKKWNALFLSKKPDSPEKLAYFIDSRNKANPKRTDVETWVDLLDLEEGRLG